MVRRYDNIQITDVSDIKLSTVDLMRWTYDVASGLEFIHDKKVIHGDLATRNILLSEDLVAKISDFGLSRQLVECSNYVKKTQAKHLLLTYKITKIFLLLHNLI